MTLAEVLDRVNRGGVKITVESRRLKVSPRSMLDEDVIIGLQANKPMIIERLRLAELTQNWICNLEYFDDIFSGDIEASTLVCWFWYHVHLLPMEPFELKQGELILYPLIFYREIAKQLAEETQMKSPSLQACLENIKVLYKRFGARDNCQSEKQD